MGKATDGSVLVLLRWPRVGKQGRLTFSEEVLIDAIKTVNASPAAVLPVMLGAEDVGPIGFLRNLGLVDGQIKGSLFPVPTAEKADWKLGLERGFSAMLWGMVDDAGVVHSVELEQIVSSGTRVRKASKTNRKQAKIIRYEHHGLDMAVQEPLKGKHRDHCLCYRCAKFYPEDHDQNCPIANLLYRLCVAEDLVTPVWECRRFIEGE